MRRNMPLVLAVVVLGICTTAWATEEYAEKTGKSCEYCHLDASGGGELTPAGKAYLAQLKEEAASGGIEGFSQRRKGISHYIRLTAGFLHIFMAFFWFGTILYVHIILKPAYAAHGLPKGEVQLGLISMVMMAITGSILTVYRVPSWSVLFETRFGILLLIKILLFTCMVILALIAVIHVGPKMKAKTSPHRPELTDKFSEEDLLEFTGPEGPTYFAYRGKVYDASLSSFWKGGAHFGRHKAGRDLSTMLSQAPHGEEKLSGLPVVGEFFPAKNNGAKKPERLFFFLAYTELVFVILIILILALWKWW